MHPLAVASRPLRALLILAVAAVAAVVAACSGGVAGTASPVPTTPPAAGSPAGTATGSPTATATAAAADNVSCAYPADRLAYFVRAEGAIYAAAADGSGATKIASDDSEHGTILDMAWSPSGASVLIVRGRPGEGGTTIPSIDRLDLGGAERRLTDTTGGDAYPAWAPDGSRVAFVSARDSILALSVMNADGSDQQPVSKDPSDHLFPTWSPDGSLIATVRRPGAAPAAGPEVDVVRPDGSGFLRLMDAPGMPLHAPTWSPDGKQVAYDGQVAEAAGGAVRSLDGDVNRPDWSPDGAHLAWFAPAGGEGRFAVMVADADGGNARPLDTGTQAHSDMFPSWSPDGGWLSFVSERDGEHGLFVAKADGSCVTHVATLAPAGELAENALPEWVPAR